MKVTESARISRSIDEGRARRRACAPVGKRGPGREDREPLPACATTSAPPSASGIVEACRAASARRAETGRGGIRSARTLCPNPSRTWFWLNDEQIGSLSHKYENHCGSNLRSVRKLAPPWLKTNGVNTNLMAPLPK
jgi:hypothetical protein